MSEELRQRQLTALEGSIKKWEDIVSGEGKDLGPVNCPCCIEFKDEFRNDPRKSPCGDCPIAIYAKASYCNNTPYDEWDDYFYDSDVDEDRDVDGNESLDIATRELTFLMKVKEAFERGEICNEHRI